MNEDGEPARGAEQLRPITIAHRAGNNLAKLNAAFDAGIEFVEADVWWRRRRVEVRHDKSSGPIPLLWDRWSLRPDRHVLLLEEVVAAAKGRGKVFLDMKGTSTQLADAVVVEAGKLDARGIIAGSGNWHHLDRLSALLPEALLFYSVGSAGRLLQLRPRLEAKTVPGISIDADILTAAIVEDLRRCEVQRIVTWQVETIERAEEVLRMGVDGVTSSNLELLARLVDGTMVRKTA